MHDNIDKVVPSLNRQVKYQALLVAGISSSSHIFPSGGRVYKVSMKSGLAKMWIGRVMEFLIEMKLIE